MTEQSRFPIVFEKCPICGCIETVAKIGYKSESTMKEQETFLETKITPLLNLTSVSVLTIPCLVRLYDDCAKCGMSYCTKVDKKALPADMVYKMLGIQPKVLQKPLVLK